MLDQIGVDVSVEGAGDILLDIEGIDEGVEDGALLLFSSGPRRAIGERGVRGRRIAGTSGKIGASEPFDRSWRGKDEGEGGDGGQKDRELHFVRIERGLAVSKSFGIDGPWMERDVQSHFI